MTVPSRLDAQDLLRHASFVRAMAWSVLGPDDRVDDAVQDTWVAALERREPPTGWRSWLASVGRRRAGDIARREARSRRHEERAARPDVTPSAEALVERAEVTQRLVAALLTLDAADRDVLLLRFWEGLPPRDVAARLGVPVETARTRVKRAIERLRRRMDEDHGGDRRRWAVPLAAWAGTPPRGVPAPWPAAAAVAVAALVAGAVVGGVALSFGARDDDADRPVEVGRAGDAGHTGDGVRPEVAQDPRVAPPPALEGAPAVDRPMNTVPAAVPSEEIVVRGFVRDRRGEPVARYPVRYSLTPRVGAHPSPSEAYTDADGQYAIHGLVPGALWMSLLPERGFPPPTEVEHELVGPWTHDFVARGEIVLAGVVEALGTEPVELWLDYREEFEGNGWGNNFGVRRVTLERSDRAFRFTALHPGVYTLRVTGPGMETIAREVRVFADVADLVVRPLPATPVRGRIAVLPPLDVSKTGAWLQPLDGGENTYLRCEDDGSFVFEGVPDGRYRLLVRNQSTLERDGKDPRRVLTERAIEVTLPVPSGRIDVTVAPDEEVGLRVRPPDGLDVVQGEVRVLDGRGWPDTATKFAARRQGREVEMSDVTFGIGFPPLRTLRDDGALLVPDMTRGTYRLRVTGVGFEPAERVVRVDGPTTVEIDLVPLRAQRLVRAEISDRYWSVEVRPEGGEPRRLLWRDARVIVSHHPVPGETEARLSPGTYEFRVVSSHHAPARLGPIRVEADEAPFVLRFPLREGAALSGRVTTRSGDPVSLLLHVFERRADGTWSRLEEKETKADEGAYRVQGLAPGRYRLSPSEDGEPVLGETDVGGADATLDLALR